MKLIKTIEESSIEESDEATYNFINQKGLPMEIKDEQTLSLILYFHRLCVPFYKILNSLNKKDIVIIILSLLNESYYLFADSQCKYLNVHKKNH
jgi:hypothetical protein